MKKIFLFLISTVFMNLLSAQNPKWEQVYEATNNSLPETALKVVDQIYNESLKSGNSPELIKAMIFQLKYKTIIDNDRLPDLIQEMEAFNATNKDVVGQAVLYSMLAEIYEQYYNNNQWNIRRRTVLAGYTPEDIREWTSKNFEDKIAELVDWSLKPSDALKKTGIEVYKELLQKGDADSYELCPTLFDLLCTRGIDRLSNLYNHDLYGEKIISYYNESIAFHKADPNKRPLLLTELNLANYTWRNSPSADRDAEYLQRLEELKKTYAGQDISVEILYREVIYYLTYSEKRDSQRAYNICREGISKYPNYDRISLLKNTLKEITQPSLSVSAPNTVYPGKDLELDIRFQNINAVTISIYKISAPVSEYANSWTRNGLYKTHGKLEKKEVFALKNEAPYAVQDSVLRIPMDKLGCYEYVIEFDGQKENINQQFSVSRLGSLLSSMKGQYKLLVTDRISGKPAEGAEVIMYSRDGRSNVVASRTKTDKLGLALVDYDRNIVSYNIIQGNDSALILTNTPYVRDYDPVKKSNFQINLFTDRSIYRPGQTVFFKGIAYQEGKDHNMTTATNAQHYTIILRDANNKEVGKKTVTTNEFGSFSGEFTLPQGTLNGYFSLEAEYNLSRIYFRVEEYKRPTFDIKFRKNEDSYSFGDKITVSGDAMTFSGISVQDKEVTYRVTKQPYWTFFRHLSAPQVTDGVVRTNDSGTFEFSFYAEKETADQSRDNVFYRYRVEATLTDSNGETQSTETSFIVGDRSMTLSLVGFSTDMNKAELPALKIKAANLQGQDIKTSGSYEIFQLIKPDSKLDNQDYSEWENGKKVLGDSFNTENELKKSTFQKLESGAYRIQVKSQDLQGRTVETQEEFVIYSEKDAKPAVPGYVWLKPIKTTCEVGEKAIIQYGSSALNVYVLYEIYKDNKQLSVSRFELSNANRKLEIPFKEEYGDGITVLLTFIKDEQVFARSVNIYRKQPDKNLTLKMEVFRNKLLPGQQEEWKISVKDTDQKPVVSELLVSMYDASLDKLTGHRWGFNPMPGISLSAPSYRSGNEFRNNNDSFHFPYDYEKEKVLSYPQINWFGFDTNTQVLRSRMKVTAIGNAAAGTTEIAVDIADLEDHKVIVQESALDNMAAISMSKADDALGGSVAGFDAAKQPEVQIRENFNETAFFYPHLKTNEQGETLISFTVPESNTTWKMMGLAHTKDVKYGQIIQEAISQKQLMITPNIPRFIRHNDQMTLTTNISNLSEEMQTGTISITFFDPNTNKPTINIANGIQQFKLEPGKTEAVSWSFRVPSTIDMTAVKIVAISQSFSDGEQHLIPVLPNRMLVTESMQLNVMSNETRTFRFDKLADNESATLENYRLTLEFTGNPMWYAIQALPTMTAPTNDDVISWFAAYYSNSLATKIAQSTPKIKQVIDTWTKQGGTKETLISNLEKNQELKAILLEETPWVLNAENESEQKQRLSLLFDLNRSTDLSSRALEKLKELKLGDGGWSWFKGMHSSVSLTQWLLYGFSQLKEADAIGIDNDTQVMLKEAVLFIDDYVAEYFSSWKKHDPNWKKKNTLSIYEVEYLRIRSLYKDITPSEKAQEAIDFYTSIAEKHWTKTDNLYIRSQIAMLAHSNGKESIAKAIIQSLREHSITKKDFGMYWANNSTYAFMFQSATCIHTFLMEAFATIDPKTEELDQLKLWLLKQKQTQEWESVPATVNAINILLQTGSDWLSSQGNAIISLGDKQFDTQQAEAGTGYLKEVFSGIEVSPKMAEVTVTKEDEGPAWGAIYWQYYEDMDKVTSAKTELNVEKKLFVEKITPSGKVMQPVDESKPIKVGDNVIVRLTVRTDRDMEYVMLKDLRASCFEPVDQLSGIQWRERVVYYQSPKDASVNYFFYNLPKGTYVFEYALYAQRVGDYSNGNCTIQCLYAPEFISHTSGGRVKLVP